MTILVIGDSTAFGAELSDLPTDRFLPTGCEYVTQDLEIKPVAPSQLAWPALLGQLVNEPVENLSIVGGSNERIYRLAVEQTSRNRYSLVICAWTTIGRFDLQYRGQDIAVSAGCYFNFDWIKTYVDQHYDPMLDFNKWVIQAVTLQAYFKQRGQPYLYIKGAPMAWEGTHYLTDQFDLANCVHWDSDVYQLTKDLPRGPSLHMLEQSHERVAHMLADRIKHG
jgi:hypothetical protein